ncbi:hypothetical protein BH708_08875 [Brachybacterium sp. P6-10-X1]|uniref:hypothetical protein n=1 Tax=Brachybacterium sp. P6-10-X1 TaxID=1903186 RepID=UPI000971AB35|nr:hypothetical protein [Brachybacterium sp. P6-10-X1]APX32814.1 hypothetical protein BH708_08875 [Brachybacterium sp. P6-10-X1]
MVDDDDARLAALALRAEQGELTAPPAAARRGPEARADTHTMLFTVLGRLPQAAESDLFGPGVQRVLYVYYPEGSTLVGAVLDPPVSVHAPTTDALDAKVRAYVAEQRGVVEADVHPFGKRVDRARAVEALERLVDGSR